MLGLKEITLPDGVTRPYSMWLSGEYPRALDGLCKILSLDMRVIDPAWIGMKLRKLLNYPEPLGDFMAFVPGARKQHWSTSAWISSICLSSPAPRAAGFLRTRLERVEGEARRAASPINWTTCS